MNELGPWDIKEGLDSYQENGICSFCGSLDPAQALRLIENGAKVCPTDKSYKMYVERDGTSQKVYFQHFSSDDWLKLIELLAQKKVEFNYPGYFYVLPYKLKVIKKEPNGENLN